MQCRSPAQVLALSDVIGNDPGTIASGPFSPDTTTFAEALAIVERLAPNAPAAAIEHLRRGVAGTIPDTPKRGDAAYPVLPAAPGDSSRSDGPR